MSTEMAWQPYPADKDSGLSWLGAIPAHWEVRRNGRLFAQRNETGYPDLPILEVSLHTGVQVRDLEGGQRKQMMTNRAQYKRAAKGDVAYNMMRLWQGAVGVAPVDGLVSPAYVVARPLPEIEPRYYAYLFRTPAYMNEINKYSRGIVTDRNRLYWDEFKQMPSPFPPLQEQRLLADFLDAESRAIRRFIRNKRRFIELLNEQKQAIINRAVTRGIDLNDQLKPSGIDWLRAIPAHWEVRSLKQIALVRLSGIDKNSVDGEIPVRLCNYTDVYRQDVIDDGMEFMKATATLSEIKNLSLHEGDVLITKDSESADDIAVPAMVGATLDGVLCGYHLALIRPFEDRLDGEFLFWSFMSPAFNWQFTVAANGVTRFGLSKHSIKNALFAVPPLDEQRRICRWIDDRLQPIHSSVARARREIELIREYRTRLINDLVTGKVDVRHLAPVLSGTEDLDEPLDGLVEGEAFDQPAPEEVEETEEVAYADD